MSRSFQLFLLISLAVFVGCDDSGTSSGDGSSPGGATTSNENSPAPGGDNNSPLFPSEIKKYESDPYQMRSPSVFVSPFQFKDVEIEDPPEPTAGSEYKISVTPASPSKDSENTNTFFFQYQYTGSGEVPAAEVYFLLTTPESKRVLKAQGLIYEEKQGTKVVLLSPKESSGKVYVCKKPADDLAKSLSNIVSIEFQQPQK